MTRPKSWRRLDSVRPGLMGDGNPKKRQLDTKTIIESIEDVVGRHGYAYVSKDGFVTPYYRFGFLKIETADVEAEYLEKHLREMG